MATENSPNSPDTPAWKPIGPHERRVAGVLVEKAKTTPAQYPLTLNSILTGSNQKSNRSPQMELETDEVEEALHQLRTLGVIVEVHGDGRVPKYRHKMYEWLGVDKAELAVLTELLLRGDQTLGELRGRAARMEPIADIGALRPILESLLSKNLIVYLTPPGRGCMVTHNLYLERELDKLKKKYGTSPQTAASARQSPAQSTASSATSPASAPQPTTATAVTSTEPSQQIAAHEAPVGQNTTEQSGAGQNVAASQDDLSAEVADLRSQVVQLTETVREQGIQITQLRDELSEAIAHVADDLHDLNEQLGS